MMALFIDEALANLAMLVASGFDGIVVIESF